MSHNPKTGAKAESLATKLARYIAEKKEFTLQELYQEFGDGYLNHTIRARLYESEAYKEKKIIRTEKGVYALIGAELEAIVEQVDTREGVYQLTHAQMTYDLVIIDSPYETAAQRGGNRSLAHFQLISPQDFKNIITEVEKVLQDDYSMVCFMISGGKSGEKDVARYLRMFEYTDLKLAKKGSYTKLNADGTVCNMGKYLMPPEQVLFYNKAGKERPEVDTNETADYRFQRPPLPSNGGYSTQKPLELMREIIKRTTRVGDRVLDLFTGSGVSLQAALGLGRKFHGFEISTETIVTHILPRMQMYAGKSGDGAPVQRVPRGALVQPALF